MTTYLDGEKEGQQLDIDDYHGQCVLVEVVTKMEGHLYKINNNIKFTYHLVYLFHNCTNVIHNYILIIILNARNHMCNNGFDYDLQI